MSIIHPLPDRVHHHSLISLGRTDRFRDGKNNYIPVYSDSRTQTFVHEEDRTRTMELTHQDIWDRLRAGKAEIRYNYHSAPIQKLLAVHGDRTLNSFSPEVQYAARLREKLIRRYEEACRTEKKKLPFSVRLQPKLDEWWQEELLGPDAKTKNGRRRRTGQALAEITNGPSWKTFRRDYEKYVEAGRNPVVLVPLHRGPGSRTVIHCRDSELFLQKMAREYLSRLKPTEAQVYRAYCAELDGENDERLAASRPLLIQFSFNKMKNAIKRFDAFEVMASREGEAAALYHFRDVKANYDIQRPGARVEIDEWKGDLITLLVKTGVWAHLPDVYIEKLPKTLRVAVTLVIDVATRYVLAVKVTPTPSAEAVAGALRMAMTDKTEHSRMAGAQTPWSAYVLPDLVAMDNGSPFLTDQFISGAQALGISIVREPAGDAPRRPYVERIFGTVGPEATHYFDGRTFASVEEKGDYNAEAHASLDMDEFTRILILTICDIYHRRRQSGLGGNSPHNEWIEATQSIRIKHPPGPQHMIAAFGYLTTARIQRDGIVVLGVTYRDEKLNALRRRIGQKDIDVMYDPTNARRVLFKARDEREWLSAENVCGLDDTVSFDEWLAALKSERDEIAENTKEGLKIMYAAMRRNRRTGVAASMRANLGGRIQTPEDMERLNRDVVRGWQASCETDETADLGKFAIPASGFLTAEEERKPYHMPDSKPTKPISMDAPSRSKFDEQEED